jgi:hypothetical protein
MFKGNIEANAGREDEKRMSDYEKLARKINVEMIESSKNRHSESS